MKKPYVVSISTVSGGGKTTIVNLLQKSLQASLTCCNVLYFDDYTFSSSPEDLFAWTVRGADFNEWNLEELKADIIKITEKSNTDYLLLDYPFGYENDMLRPFIDVAVFIDTPLDIALCRRILRDYKGGGRKTLFSDLQYYAGRGRYAYLPMIQTVKPNTDLIVDGLLPPEEITKVILSAIQKKTPQA